MSREKIGRKQSSTLSAKATYEILFEDGYRPKLVPGAKPLHSLKWENIINDRNVVHSQSGKSIILVDTSDLNRPLFDLKIKGMMSENSISFLQHHAQVQMKPSP